MATTDRQGGRKATEGTLDHYKKLFKGPCPNLAFPVRHLYKGYGLMKQFLSGGFNKGGHGKDLEPTMDDTEGRDDGF